MKNTAILSSTNIHNNLPLTSTIAEAAPKTLAQPTAALPHLKNSTILLLQQGVTCNHKHTPKPMTFVKIHENAFFNRYDVAYFRCPKCQQAKRSYWRITPFGISEQLVIEKC